MANGSSGRTEPGRTIFDFFSENKRLALTLAVVIIILAVIYSVVIHTIGKPGEEIKVFFGLVTYTKASTGVSSEVSKKRKTRLNDIPTVRSTEKAVDGIDGITNKNGERNVCNICDAVRSLDDQELRKLLGQLFIVGFIGVGTEVGSNDLVEQLVSKHLVGGLVFYDRNVLPISKKFSQDDVTENLINFINDIKAENRQHDFLPNHDLDTLPLFFGVDFEGGNVAPLVKAGIATPCPSPMALASLRNKNAVLKASRLIASELNNLGFNMNFAPVVDVTTSDTNNLIQERSFGEEPSFVQSLALEFIRGQIAHNIIPVIKHFPGHGMTDAGFETPDLPISKQRFEAFASGIGPFASIVGKQHAPAIMTSHMELICSGVKGNVAFSPIVINDLLQSTNNIQFPGGNVLGGLNYSGVVMADNLLAPCITAMSGVMQPNLDRYLNRVKNNVLASFDAGHHLLMLSHIFPEQDRETAIKHREVAKDKFRWAVTLNEFVQVYKFMDKSIFEVKDKQIRIKRIKKLQKALLKIAHLKEGLIDYDAKKSLDSFYRNRINGDHSNLAQELFNKSFVVLKSQVKYVSMSSLGKNDTVTVFMPSRFMSYKGIEKAKRATDYSERLLHNINAFHFTRSLYKHFVNKTNLIFELEKFNPVDLSEQKVRAKRIIEILERNGSDHVVFLINKRVRWFLLQHVLEEMVSSNKFSLEQVSAVITNDATMLRSRSDNIGIKKVNKLLEKINIIIAFSGYGYRAELLASQLATGEIDKRKAMLPFKIDVLNPLPNYRLSDNPF